MRIDIGVELNSEKIAEIKIDNISELQKQMQNNARKEAESIAYAEKCEYKILYT